MMVREGGRCEDVVLGVQVDVVGGSIMNER